MKLIMENWKRFLKEGEVQEEGLKDIAMAGALGLSSLAAPAQAADAPIDDAPVQVDQAESSSTTLDITVPMRGSLQNAMDRAGEQARLKGAGELNTAPENVTVQRTDVKMGSGTVTVSFNVSVKKSVNEQDESMSAYDLGAELRNIQMDTMHSSGSKDQPAVIRMKDVVDLYGDTIEKAVKALVSLGERDLAEKLHAQLERAKNHVKKGQEKVAYKDEPDAAGKLQSGAEKFYAIFDAAGDALLRAKSSEE